MSDTVLVKFVDENGCVSYQEEQVEPIPLYRLGDWVELLNGEQEGMIIEVNITHRFIDYIKSETSIIYTIDPFQQDEITVMEDEIKGWKDK